MAGCVTTPRPPAPGYDLAVTVENETDRGYDVAVTVENEDGEVVLERSTSLPAGSELGFSETLAAGRYTITVDLDGRTSVRAFWPTANCADFQVRTAIDAAGQVSNAVRCADSTTTAADGSTRSADR